MDRVDARGMSCPQPVLMAKNAIKGLPSEVEILVDIDPEAVHREFLLKFFGEQMAEKSVYP